MSDLSELLKSLDEIEEIVRKATPGVLYFGELSVEVSHSLAAKTADTDTVWCTYQHTDDGDYVTAITGNGPHSRANAQFYAGAAPTILGLIGTLRDICSNLEPIEGETP